MMRMWMLTALVLVLAPASAAHAHTVDSIDNKYRIEIGWINEPVLSGETNGIELQISPMIPCPDILPLECANQQEFHDGIAGLEDDLKLELLYRADKITLRLYPNHNTPGVYHAFVHPTVSGFYQVNLLGSIGETQVSMSLHPPKVEERAYIEFPLPEDAGVAETREAIAGIENRLAEIDTELQSLTSSAESVSSQVKDMDAEIRGLQDRTEAGPEAALSYAAIALGGAAVAIVVAATRIRPAAR